MRIFFLISLPVNVNINSPASVLTAVLFITSILTVDHLVTAAVIGDAAAVFALKLSRFAQGHCGEPSS